MKSPKGWVDAQTMIYFNMDLYCTLVEKSIITNITCFACSLFKHYMITELCVVSSLLIYLENIVSNCQNLACFSSSGGPICIVHVCLLSLSLSSNVKSLFGQSNSLSTWLFFICTLFS